MGPHAPDCINLERLGPVCTIVKLMCGGHDEARQLEEMIHAAIREGRMAKRLRHMPYWVQALARESESIDAEAHRHHMTVEDVIALRTERFGREESDRRHWYDGRVTERQPSSE